MTGGEERVRGQGRQEKEDGELCLGDFNVILDQSEKCWVVDLFLIPLMMICFDLLWINLV